MHERITQSQLESYLWGAAVLLRGTIDAGDYKQFIFPLLFYKRLCDAFDEETQIALAESGGDREFAAFPENHRFQIPPGAHWRVVRQAARDVGRVLQSALRAIETANPDKLYGIFGDAQWTNKDRLTDAMLHDLIEHFSSLELTVANLPEDELGQGYEYLIKKFADDSGHTAAEFYTNRTVVHLMTELLQPRPGESIYDPTCGSGGMLLSCIAQLRRQGKEWRNVRLYGQERNLMTSSIARMNCFLHGIEDFRIERGDTLSEPKFVEGDRLMQFDVVLANPPYSIKQWDRAAFASDPWGRNIFGAPPQGRADYAFWQHIICSLSPKTGRCAILFPHGVLFRQEEAEMRRKLIEADLIECVLGLGPNLFYNSPMEACVVICCMNKPRERRGKILFINAVNEVTRERAQSFLTKEHVGHIVEAYNYFRAKTGFAGVATLEEIREKDGNLSIPLYVKSESSAANSVEKEEATCRNDDLSQSLGTWLTSRKEVATSLHCILPGISFPAADETLKALEACSIFDRSKWQRVRFGDVVENLNETEHNPMEKGIERFIGLEHIEPGSLHIRSWGKVIDGTTFTRCCQSGQVLFGKRRAYQRKVAVAEFDALVSGDIYVFAPKNNELLPELLPFICMSERFFQHAVGTSAGSLSPRTNWNHLAEFEVDLPPIDQQRRIVELLWAVDDCIMKGYMLHSSLKAFYRVTLDRGCSENVVGKHQLGDIVDYASDGPFGSKLKTEHYASFGARVIRLQNVGDGQFDDTDKAFISMDYFGELQHYEVRAEDVIVARLGDETHSVGRAALIPGTLGPAVNKADCFCLRGSPRKVVNAYIVYFLNSKFGMEQVKALAQGTTRLRINVGNLKTVLVSLPSLSQQVILVQQLDEMQRLLTIVAHSLKCNYRMRDALLNEIFEDMQSEFGNTVRSLTSTEVI